MFYGSIELKKINALVMKGLQWGFKLESPIPPLEDKCCCINIVRSILINVYTENQNKIPNNRSKHSSFKLF